MVTDPISDFLTRVRNAQSAGHKAVSYTHLDVYKRQANDFVQPQ